MKQHTKRTCARGLAAGALSPVLLASTALAQDYPPKVTFSIDGHGPTIAVQDAFTTVRITEGDVLTPATGAPFGPYAPVFSAPAPPGIAINAGMPPTGPGLGLAAYTACVGHPPGSICPVEVDALSYGSDDPLPAQILRPGTVWFSVDEYARGAGTSVAPDVKSEGATGAQEAAGDVFTGKCPVGVAPLSSTAPPMGNVAGVDGNGLPNSVGTVYPGLGLVEPSPPGTPPDLGDNLDAVDLGTAFSGPGGPFPVYFSLDASFVDPLTGFPLSGTAAVQGVSGADVLVVTGAVGAGPIVFAPAASLGLDLTGPNTDDLDGLALWENGTGVFEPSGVPHDWVGTGATRDMLLFSVRRGSAVIGRPDSRFGLPIEPGDILSTPLPTALGGVSPFPSIYIAAEVLGLGTARGGMGLFGDELDALDTKLVPGADCNGNCVPDKLDIKNGLLHDNNMDCVADECQDGGGNPECFCLAGNAPCANPGVESGCANSTGFGGILSATGSSSVVGDDLFLIMTPLPPFQFGIFYMGPTPISAPFGDGLRCVSGVVWRYPVLNTGTPGTGAFGPVVGHANANFGASGQITSGATWLFQGWYRDPNGPCGNGFNLTNRLALTFVP